MLEKLLSDVARSPAAIAHLGIYATAAKKRARIYAICTVLLAFAICFQSATIILFPPNNANTANESDIIYGGVSSREDLLSAYDRNVGFVRDIFSSLNISRSDLMGTIDTSLDLDEHSVVLGKTPMLGTEAGELYYDVGSTKLTATPALSLYPLHTQLDVLSGTTQSTTFSILKSNGMIVLPSTTALPAHLSSPLETTITAIDLADNQYVRSTLQPGDRVLINFAIANTTSDAIVNHTETFVIRDILEYAGVIDGGGGFFSGDQSAVSWSDISLPPAETTNRNITIRIDDTIVASPQGFTNPLSYDCTLSLAAKNALHLAVACPLEKDIEQLSQSLPDIPSWLTISMTGGLLLLSASLYIYQRTIQREIRIIRHLINTGAF